MEALGQVTTAYALTGDEKFKLGKHQLLDWGYLKPVLRQKVLFDDFMRLDGGNGGKSVSDPSAFLDAYWMARYYGMILPPQVSEDQLLTVEKRGLQLGAKPYDGPLRPDLGF